MSIVGKDFDRLESIEELTESIEMGMDIEFRLHGMRYNISWRNNKPFICICPDGDAVFYDTTKKLLFEYKVNGQALKDCWKDIKILAM